MHLSVNTDQCTLCANYKNSNDDDKKDLQQEYDNHLRNKEKSRLEKNGCRARKNGSISCGCL